MKTIGERLAMLDAWLETMRNEAGYGGPVAHWWQNSFYFCGAALDWRYEGIVWGYLNMFRATDDTLWLQRATRAADDIVRGQLPGGNFRNSSFELNPYSGGTPHEAACDIALLAVAQSLRGQGEDFSTYLQAAQRNINAYYIGILWHADAQYFRDHSNGLNFVPNKACTLSEALFMLADLTDDDELIERYALPTLRAVLSHQVNTDPKLNGATCQYSSNDKPKRWYFPYYAARCVPALLMAYQHTDEAKFLDAAIASMEFVARWQYEDGSFPQVVYPEGKLNRYQQWIAGNGDILRAFQLLEPYGYQHDLSMAESWLLDGQHKNGSFRTAHGFETKTSQKKPPQTSSFRDVLPVVGWTDKAFRYLSEQLAKDEIITPIDAPLPTISHTCRLRGQSMQYTEDDEQIMLKRRNKTFYHWRKGDDWASIHTPKLMWK